MALPGIPDSIRKKMKENTEERYLVCPAVYISVMHISQTQLIPRSMVFQNP